MRFPLSTSALHFAAQAPATAAGTHAEPDLFHIPAAELRYGNARCYHHQSKVETAHPRDALQAHAMQP